VTALATNRATLAVEPGGRVAAGARGCFDWVVHHKPEPVAFLVTSLHALGDDEVLDVEVALAPGASAVVTTTGPGVLLRTERPVVQRWRLALGRASTLTLLPWHTLPFAGSRAELAVEATLDRSAVLVAWDVLAAGRVAHGERFAMARLGSAWRLSLGGEIVLDERLRVGAEDAPLAWAATAGRTHVGSLLVAGLADAMLPLDAARALLATSPDLAGASRPAEALLVSRALDRSAERIERGFWPVVLAARGAAGAGSLEPEAIARRWF
jgi:urease accessory protein